MPTRGRRLPPRGLSALKASTENVPGAAFLLRAGKPLTDQSREALVDLLEHLTDSCELLPTTAWDRVPRLAMRVRDHQLDAKPLPPPNVGGGSSTPSAAA